MQALRGVGIDALVAALERAVIGGADRRLLRHLLLRHAEPVAQLAQPIGVTRSAGVFPRAAASLHRREFLCASISCATSFPMIIVLNSNGSKFPLNGLVVAPRLSMASHRPNS